MIANLFARVLARFRGPPRAALTMEVLGLRGSTIEVRDQTTGQTWNGRAVRVLNEHPATTAESMLGLLFDSSGSPPLSIGSVVSYKDRRFVIEASGNIRGVTVHEIN